MVLASLFPLRGKGVRLLLRHQSHLSGLNPAPTVGCGISPRLEKRLQFTVLKDLHLCSVGSVAKPAVLLNLIASRASLASSGLHGLENVVSLNIRGTDNIASLGVELSDWLSKNAVCLNLHRCSRLVELGNKRFSSSEVCKLERTNPSEGMSKRRIFPN